MVLIKNLAWLATSEQQKHYVLHINNKPPEYRTFLGLGGMAHSVMNSNTNITLPLIDKLKKFVLSTQEDTSRVIDELYLSKGKRVPKRYTDMLDKYEEKLKLLRSLKLVLQKHQKYKSMKVTGPEKGTAALKRWSNRARKTHWAPGGRGASLLSQKYKNGFYFTKS